MRYSLRRFFLVSLASFAFSNPATAQTGKASASGAVGTAFVTTMLNLLKPTLCLQQKGDGGTTEFYDSKGLYLLSTVDGPQNAIAAVDAKTAPLLRAVSGFQRDAANKCPFLSGKKLRTYAEQIYAIDEFIGFINKKPTELKAKKLRYMDKEYDDKTKLSKNVEKAYKGFEELKTYLYKDADGVVHTGREILIGDAMILTGDCTNVGGVGCGNQGSDKRVGELHTHPNADCAGCFPVPANHPSSFDYKIKASSYYPGYCEYYDVVVSPKFVYFINGRTKINGTCPGDARKSMVFSVKNTFSNDPKLNPTKEYVEKSIKADEYYNKHAKWPTGPDAPNDQNNPWAQ